MKSVHLTFRFGMACLGIASALALPAWGQEAESETEIEWGEKFELAPGVKLTDVDYFRGYEPTVVKYTDELKLISKGMRSAKNPGSQCFNRATVWAYEISSDYQKKFNRPLNMVKVFRFFSTQFRDTNKYDWWFHVAPGFLIEPMVNSKSLHRDQLMMIDKRAYAGAVMFGDWDRYFFNLAGTKTVSSRCRQVKTYYEFTQLRDLRTEDCFDLIVPMYYHVPDDFAAVEKYGKSYLPLVWEDDVLLEAYRQAGFGRVR